MTKEEKMDFQELCNEFEILHNNFKRENRSLEGGLKNLKGFIDKNSYNDMLKSLLQKGIINKSCYDNLYVYKENRSSLVRRKYN